jgi:type IV secretory pathway TraG/TraD family ATPase VirD4
MSVTVRTSHEDTTLVLGPPRSNKSRRLMIRRVAESPGGVLASSLRADLLLATIEHRASLGRPVYVIDPANVSGWPRRSGWDLIGGCADPRTAERRARNLVMPAGLTDRANSAQWQESAAVVMRCFLHAAALGGRGTSDLRRWAANSLDTTPVSLMSQPGAAPGWASTLEGMQKHAEETRESIWMNVRLGLDALALPEVTDFVSTAGFDVARALEENATIYVLGDPMLESLGRVTTAFIGEVMARAHEVARGRAGQRLAPPFHFHLDEAANVAAVAGLPAYLSFFGGSGLPVTTVIHSLAQARRVWGEHGAVELWENSLHKVLLPGLSNLEDLEDISRMIGDVWITTQSRQSGSRQGANTGMSEQQVRAIPPDRIRQLPEGTALMLPNAMAPVHLRMRTWEQGPLGRTLRRGYARAVAKVGAPPALDLEIDEDEPE